MRYTTIIDITEYPDIYRNPNARFIYLHMVLKSGYHDDDRDQYRQSIRRIGYDLGMTLSAVRHSLKVLQKAGLIVHENGCFYVKKFVLEKTITPRVRSEKKKKEAENRERERQIQEEQTQREREESRRYREARKAGKNPLLEFVKTLMEKAENGDKEAIESLRKYSTQVKQIKAQQ